MQLNLIVKKKNRSENKTTLDSTMSTKQDRKQILDTLEQEYLSDLSLHLYSTFLLHRINPNFPRKKWANWPLPFDEVPIPQGFKQDGDNLVDEYDGDIDLNQAVFEESVRELKESKKSKRRKITSGNAVSTAMSESEEEEDELEDESEEESEDSEESDDSDSPVKPIVEITTTEQVANAKSALINELATVIHRTIRNKLKPQQTTPDIMSHPNMIHLTTQLANKFDKLLSNLAVNKFSETIDWTHVLQAGLECESTPYEKFDTEQYRTAYNRCEALFEDLHYNYEFEEDVSPPEGVLTKEGFNVGEYLKFLEETTAGAAQHKYAELAKEHLIEFQKKYKDKQAFKQNYFKRLEIEDKYQQVSWTKEKGPSTKIKLAPDLSNLEEMRASILAYGNNGINQVTYILENI